jgi:anti-sigma B factor antagonist
VKMEMRELEAKARLIKLMGSLDIAGTGEIETRFAGYCAAPEARVLVDLSGVDFLASIGIRLLVTNAKAVKRHGSRMVILNPVPDVRNVLEVSGIPQIIPMYESMESAEAVLLAS